MYAEHEVPARAGWPNQGKLVRGHCRSRGSQVRTAPRGRPRTGSERESAVRVRTRGRAGTLALAFGEQRAVGRQPDSRRAAPKLLQAHRRIWPHVIVGDGRWSGESAAATRKCERRA